MLTSVASVGRVSTVGRHGGSRVAGRGVSGCSGGSPVHGGVLVVSSIVHVLLVFHVQGFLAFDRLSVELYVLK